LRLSNEGAGPQPGEKTEQLTLPEIIKNMCSCC